jgi:uncharacterized protein YecE (DUF72 family)
LERYAGRFDCVEINSSFHRSHRATTYRRWGEATPPEFRFSVKLPKQITHANRLAGSREPLSKFAAEVGGLGVKLGVVLVQLPPSLAFEEGVVGEFFGQLTEVIHCSVVVEPRHASWFDEAVTSFLIALGVGRVAADPPVARATAEPIAGSGLAYYRWHGSPRVYYSSYDQSTLTDLARRVVTAETASDEAWCIFDNTAAGAATDNALLLQDLVSQTLAVRKCIAPR